MLNLIYQKLLMKYVDNLELVYFLHVKSIILEFWTWCCPLCYANLKRMGYTKLRYEPLWVTMTQNIDTTTHYDPIVNRIQCHDPKKNKRSPFTYLILSQKYLIWSKNWKMLCLKRNLARVCIRGFWLRIW